MMQMVTQFYQVKVSEMTNSDLCGKKKLKHPKAGTLQNLSVADMKTKLKGVKNVSKMKRKELCDKLLAHMTKSISSKSNNLGMGFIHYDGHNSCYIDTAIFSLFHDPRITWVKQVFFKKDLPFAESNPKLHELCQQVRTTLRSIYQGLHNKNIHTRPMTCSRLRQYFATFDNLSNPKHDPRKGENMKWLTKQQEPTDVANILMRIFDIQPDVKTRVVSKTMKRTDKLFFNSPFIDVGVLKANKLVHMRDFVPKNVDTFTLEDGTKYTKVTRVIQSRLLVVNVVRNFLDVEKVTTPVIPEEELRVCAVRQGEKCKKILRCVSIMIHHGSAKGGHYTCVFKHHKDGCWYHYNDLSEGYEHIGDFMDVLRWKNGIVPKNLVNCVYAKV